LAGAVHAPDWAPQVYDADENRQYFFDQVRNGCRCRAALATCPVPVGGVAVRGA
jgi:hypothetical protein